MLRMCFFAGIGMVLGAIAAMVIGPPGAGGAMLGIGIAVASISGTLVLIGRVSGGLQSASPQVVEAAKSAGRVGSARVDSLRQTGTMINEQPVCELELTVQPRTGAAYRLKLRRVVPLTSLAAFQPGSRHAVAILTPDGPEVEFLVDGSGPDAFTADIPPVESAGELREARSGDIRADGTVRGPIVGTGRRGRPLRIVVYILVTGIAAALVLLPHRGSVEETLASIPEGRLHSDLREPEPLLRALDRITDEIGHDAVVQITVSEDLITFDSPVRPGAKETDSWIYRAGELERTGPASIQPESADEQFSLGDVEWAALWSELQEAQQETGIRDDGEASFSASRSADDDIESESFAEPVGDVEVISSLKDDYHSATLRIRADGSGYEVTG